MPLCVMARSVCLLVNTSVAVCVSKQVHVGGKVCMFAGDVVRLLVSRSMNATVRSMCFMM